VSIKKIIIFYGIMAWYIHIFFSCVAKPFNVHEFDSSDCRRLIASHQSGHQSVNAACRKLELESQPLSLLGESQRLPYGSTTEDTDTFTDSERNLKPGHWINISGLDQVQYANRYTRYLIFEIWRHCRWWCLSAFWLSQSVSQTLELVVIVIVTTSHPHPHSHPRRLRIGFGFLLLSPGRFTNKWKWICLLYILLLPKRKRRITALRQHLQSIQWENPREREKYISQKTSDWGLQSMKIAVVHPELQTKAACWVPDTFFWRCWFATREMVSIRPVDSIN